MRSARWASLLVLGFALSSASVAGSAEPTGPVVPTFTCPTESAPGVVIHRSPLARGGGLLADWDGPGQNATTLYWHVEGSSPDFSAGQRAALIAALQAWADAAEIAFIEVPVPNLNRAIDYDFLVGDHGATEPAEAGDPDCPFAGPGGVLAHAGFPPGANSTCVNPMGESFAGNVHFDEAETWEQDTGSATAFSLTLIACHEVGHAIGLVHDNSGGGDVMRPTFSAADGFLGLSDDDIANLQGGYSSDPGFVITLNETGVWVDSDAVAPEYGTSVRPFDTVAEGANGVPPLSTDIVVHIDAGSYPGAVTITQNMILQAENGVVTIGN